MTGVTSTSAVLRAEINPNGLSTQFHFLYLTQAEFEANLAAGHDGFDGARAAPASGSGIGSGSSAQKVFFTLTAPFNALVPDTAYRFRAVASNEAGPAEGPIRVMRTTSTEPESGLPDGRAWELVSPPDKGGGAIAAPGALFRGGEIQAAAGGGGITYGSATAFADPVSSPPVSQYLSVRGPDAWSTVNLSPPQESDGYGDDPDGAPFRLFSDDLERGLMLNGRRCALEGTCPPSYSLWSGGSWEAIAGASGLRLEGATSDLRHLVFGAEDGLFEWSDGGIEPISPVSGATLAAPIGAISDHGSSVYFTLPESGPTYLYEQGLGARLVPETGAGAAFQAASADGSTAYFTRGGQLYRYTAGAGTSAPIAVGVVGVLAVSRDGSRVYYQDGSGLEEWHDGAVHQVAAGADATLASDYPPALATARLSADGTVLAFLSAAAIGENDNSDAETGMPDAEVYLYDADADVLACASCNPTGERPTGSASIPGALVNGSTTAYRPRVLSADGRRLFFETADPLVKSDTNSALDVYQWEAVGEGSCAQAPGCVTPISGDRGEGGRFLDASADGTDVFFLTGDSLVAADAGSIDAYDARVGGGLPEPEPPIPCNGDACQPLPSPPQDPTAGSSVAAAPNPPPHYFKERKHRRHRHAHKHKHHRHKQAKGRR